MRLDGRNEGVGDVRPLRRATGEGVQSGEFGGLALEHQALHRADHALADRIEKGVPLVVGHQARHGPAGVEVFDAALEDACGELGAAVAAGGHLELEGIEDGGVDGGCGHAASLARTTQTRRPGGAIRSFGWRTSKITTVA